MGKAKKGKGKDGDSAAAKSTEPIPEHGVILTTVRASLVAENTNLYDCFAVITVEGQNIRCNQPLPLRTVVPRGQKLCLLTVDQEDPRQGYNWRYDCSIHMGNPTVQHNDTVRYRYPMSGRYPLGQGYGGAFSHQGQRHYALDFVMPEGTPVMCARSGTVVKTATEFVVGGPDPALMGKANGVWVLHDDGSFGVYLHLKAVTGVTVRVGDAVKEGQTLGRSGFTGYGTQPHLHFEVGTCSMEGGLQTVPIHFVDVPAADLQANTEVGVEGGHSLVEQDSVAVSQSRSMRTKMDRVTVRPEAPAVPPQFENDRWGAVSYQLDVLDQELGCWEPQTSQEVADMKTRIFAVAKEANSLKDQVLTARGSSIFKKYQSVAKSAEMRSDFVKGPVIKHTPPSRPSGGGAATASGGQPQMPRRDTKNRAGSVGGGAAPSVPSRGNKRHTMALSPGAGSPVAVPSRDSKRSSTGAPAPLLPSRDDKRSSTNAPMPVPSRESKRLSTGGGSPQLPSREEKRSSTNAPMPVPSRESKRLSTGGGSPQLPSREEKRSSTNAPMPVPSRDSKRASSNAPVPMPSRDSKQLSPRVPSREDRRASSNAPVPVPSRESKQTSPHVPSRTSKRLSVAPVPAPDPSTQQQAQQYQQHQQQPQQPQPPSRNSKRLSSAPHPQQQQQQQQRTAARRFAVVKQDHASASRGELAVRAGNVLQMVAASDGASVRYTADLSTDPDPASLGRVPAHLVREVAPRTVEAVADWPGDEPGDCAVHRGQRVPVVEVWDNGWLCGVDDAGQLGPVPSTLVRELV